MAKPSKSTINAIAVLSILIIWIITAFHDPSMSIWFLMSVFMFYVFWVWILPYILDKTTPAIQELQEINQKFYEKCPIANTRLNDETWDCLSKSEFDRWESAQQAYMEHILDRHQDWCTLLPQRMNQLYATYKSYSSQVTVIYQEIEGLFKKLQQNRFKKHIIFAPDNIVLAVRVTYTSPRGRNYYEKTYKMQYKDVLTYLRTFPTAKNTYLPDAFIRHNNKFVDCEGTYVLYNQQDNKYYVGQATSLKRRLHQHFTGKGNGDVYMDYRLGKPFTIYIFPLGDSQFKTLNEQERHYIAKYRAFETGYNKTHGNL